MDFGVTLVVTLTVIAVVALAVVLARQGHPESASGHEPVDTEVEQGPTQADYPPGARPAGPGAEVDDPGDLYGEDPDRQDASRRRG